MSLYSQAAGAAPGQEANYRHYHVGRQGRRLPGEFTLEAAERAAAALNDSSVKDWQAYRCPLTYGSELQQIQKQLPTPANFPKGANSNVQRVRS